MLAVAAALCLSLSAAASAQTVIYVDVDATGASNGSSWTDAFTDLQDALSAASTGNEIWVAEGTYKPTTGSDRTISFQLAEGVALYGGFVGTESLRSERDWTAHETILSGDLLGDDDPAYALDDPLRMNGENSWHVVIGADNATLDGVAVAGGHANDWPGIDGAGMYNDGVTGLTVASCRFAGNSAGFSGGGMYNYFCGEAEVTNCTFTGNSAAFQGGGIWNNCTDAVVTSCALAGNSAGRYGGGIAGSNSSSLKVTDCVFTGNSADYGGGFANPYYSSSAEITNCTFTGNSARWGGSGIYNYHSDSVVTNCILWGDSGPREIHNEGDEPPTVTYSCVQGGYEGAGNIDADPRFVDAVGGDLHLQAGSPCIDAADWSKAPATDKDGNVRHDDAGLPDTGVGAETYADIGAYEFQGETPPSVNICAPATGTAWPVGREVTILWTAAGSVSDVKIEISRDGGLTWEPTPLAASTPNDRSFTWAVTDGGEPLPQTDCRIRISKAAGGGPTATSERFAISSGVWYVDSNAPAGGHGLSWATAFRHPQDAVDAASDSQEVWVAAGTYTPRDPATDTVLLTLKDGVAVYGGFAGDELARDERDWAAYPVVLDGDSNGDEAGDVFHVVVGAWDAAFDGFTVTHGNANGDQPDNRGGGMFIDSVAGLTVANCTFTGNWASWHGGGLYNWDYPSVEITDCTFSGNSAGQGGGGIYDDYCYVEVRVTDCMFFGNRAQHGGGIANSSAHVNVANCTFAGNSAVTGGGAIHNEDSFPSIVNCTLTGNSAGLGGGMANEWDSTPVVTNCVLWANTASVEPVLYDGLGSSTTVTYSCVDGGWTGEGNTDANPLFVNPGHWDADEWVDGDYHLRPRSPCIDRADGDAAPELDMDGNPRHDDPGIPNFGSGAIEYADMGAYESQGDSRGEPVTPFAGGCVPPSEGPAPAGKLAVLAVFVLAALARRRRSPSAGRS